MNLGYQDDAVTVYNGDATEVLSRMTPGTFNACITSPPYWGLRDYGAEGQLGLEATPDKYVANMVNVFRLVRRALREDGTLWLNLGDSYAGGGNGGGGSFAKDGIRTPMVGTDKDRRPAWKLGGNQVPTGLKPKDLIGIPWRIAFALQADGWYLRSDIIWHKPNPMPESVKDRPTKAHEYLFLLSKSSRYYYDAEAVREPFADAWNGNPGTYQRTSQATRRAINQHINTGGALNVETSGERKGRNRRDVWTIAPKPYKGAHFATFPEALVEPCILAGSPVGGKVLDPFAGSGTTLAVAKRLDRRAFGIELNAEYLPLIVERCQSVPHSAVRESA